MECPPAVSKGSAARVAAGGEVSGVNVSWGSAAGWRDGGRCDPGLAGCVESPDAGAGAGGAHF